MAKEYLTVNGKLVTIDSKLVQVPNQEGLNDLADKNGALATQYDMLVNEIENLIVNGVIDGSPKGVYDNLSALQTALPSGATGVYLTKDNGHWCFWNGTAWQDGGVYLNDTYNILNMEYVNGNITCDYNFAKEVPLYAILKNVITSDTSKYYVGNKEEIQETYIGEDESTYHRKELTFYFKGFGKVLVVYDELGGTTYTIEQDDIYTKDEVNGLIKNKKSIIYVKSLPTTDIDENVIYGLSVVGNCTLYQGSNAMIVMPIIYDESEIDTSQDGYVYNITTDMPYMIMGGEYAPFSDLGEMGVIYGGSATSTETFTDESTFYVLIGEEQIKFYIYKNAWYRLLDDTGDTPLKLQGQDQIIRRAESSYYIGSQFEYSFNSTQNSKFDYIDYSNPDIPELSQKESQNPKINVSIGKQGDFTKNSIFVSVGDSNNGTSKIRITPIETDFISGKLKYDNKEVATQEYAESRINYSINNVNTNIMKLDNELTDLKEALYGYVLDTTPVEIENTIPTTTTISDTTYNLVDNVRGLVKSVNGNTLKSENLILFEDIEETTLHGATYSVKNGKILVNGTIENNKYWNIKLTQITLPAGNYTLSVFNNNTYTGFPQGLKKDGSWFAYCDVSKLNSTTTFTLTETTTLDYYFYGSPNTFNNFIMTPMIVKGSTAPTEFKQGFDGLKSVEYEGLKITNLKGVSNTLLPFNTTLRGVGTAKDKIVISENENGLYTVTKVSNIGVVDLGTLNYTYESANNRFLTPFDKYGAIPTSGRKEVLSSLYSFDSEATDKDLVAFVASNKNLYLYNFAYTDVNIFKTAMQGIMLQYELATPTTEVLSTNLTEAEVMQLLELGGSVEVINQNSDYVNGSTTIEMVYKLINS